MPLIKVRFKNGIDEIQCEEILSVDGQPYVSGHDLDEAFQDQAMFNTQVTTQINDLKENMNAFLAGMAQGAGHPGVEIG